MGKDDKGYPYYLLQNCDSPWGDYGHILHCGMTSHLGRSNGYLQLERTGPFVPPITDSGDFVVKDDFKNKLEGSGLTGFSFLPVIKKRIVRLDWHKWDRELDEPPVYPSTGEPEDYILKRRHNPKLAEEIGPIWELVVSKESRIVRRQKEKSESIFDVDICLIAESWPGVDFFRADGVMFIFITVRAKKWLEENAGDSLSFTEALMAD